MKIKTLSMTVIMGFIGLMIMIHAFNSQAATGSIACSTAYGEKKFTIHEDSIAFHKEDESGISRAISSVDSHSVRTHTKQNGFVKTLYIDGNKHRIGIQDTKSFSEANDYLSITSPKGHEMTYPLDCHSV